MIVFEEKNSLTAAAISSAFAATVTGVSVGARDAVECMCTSQRLRRIGQRRSVAFCRGSTGSFLVSPIRHEQFLAIVQQLVERNGEFIVIFQVPLDSDFPT